MRVYRHNLTWMLMFGVIALMFLKLPPMAAKQDSIINTYSALVEVDALARQQYVEAIADDRLVEGAIRGMMVQLDPYSGYISPEELPAFERHNRGRFCGVGVEVGVQEGHIVVIAPIEGSPAAAAGVMAGDFVLSIDGKDLKHRSAFEAEEMLVGGPGTKVRVEFRHAGEQGARELTLTRVPLSLRTIHGFRRDADGRWDYTIRGKHEIGYIRVSNFRENTCTDFDEALGELRACGTRGLILDLRFNPGGFMHQAVAMADRFLSDGLIVSTVTRRNAVEEYRASPDPSDLDIPVVVLMNSASASSSEIVAGALQSRGRAMVVGERSFGKGSVQHLIRLVGQRAAIKLTVAYYRLPDGRIIHRTQENADSGAWGIRPDVEVALRPDEVQRIMESRRALDLPASDGSAGAEIEVDRQLAAAIAMLADRVGGDGMQNGESGMRN